MPSTEPDLRACRVRLRGVRKSYAMGSRRVEALRGVDLELIGPGFHAIMGPSGSGKSTLLHLLAGLDAADSGELEVGDSRLDGLSEGELTLHRRRRSGVVFQGFNLLPTLTALENVTLPSTLDGMTHASVAGRAEALLRELGLGDRIDHRPDALSGGEQQRVAIARALLNEPPVLLADEPTGNLDSDTSDRLWRLLADLAARRGMLVVMVTHEPAAAAHCERVHVLRDGLLAGSFDVQGMDASQLALRAADLVRPPR
ncbi:MAG: ABC transporter ATP-binding protein [Planctomycetes bacterium]|nr:ABC transporter ATP-binding protein [Planctomycetota bacterium]